MAINKQLKYYLVLGPDYEYTEIIDECGGPRFPARDVVFVAAEDEKGAISTGIKMFRTFHKNETYVCDWNAGYVNPFSEVTAKKNN